MKYIKYLAVSALCAMSLTSCNDYLDRLPDDRAEVKTVSQVKELLTSAYPQGNNNTIMELMSDNVSDNGTSYASTPLKDELYRFEDVDDTGNDSPYFVWNQLYKSVATANQALEYLGQVTPTEESAAVEAEAKMIRAYSMFQLATTFCMAWDESKADEYMGLPYPKEPAKFIGGQDDRGTLRQLYANIDKDIEEALPKIDESICLFLSITSTERLLTHSLLASTCITTIWTSVSRMLTRFSALTHVLTCVTSSSTLSSVLRISVTSMSSLARKLTSCCWLLTLLRVTW